MLPIAQQTSHVSGDADLGAKDGLRNAAAIIAAFGRTYLSKMSGVFVFLDVEGPPHASLGAKYYRAWSHALISAGKDDMVFRDSNADGPINFWPGVYGAERDDATWRSLVAAMKGGATCSGTWIARPGKIGCQPLDPWIEKFIRPKLLPSSVRILLWQGVQEGQNIDYNRANLATSDELLSGLVLPPDMQKEWLSAADEPVVKLRQRAGADEPAARRAPLKKKAAKGRTHSRDANLISGDAQLLRGRLDQTIDGANRNVNLLFATTRELKSANDSQCVEFSDHRGKVLVFGGARVHIPEGHRIGHLERPWGVFPSSAPRSFAVKRTGGSTSSSAGSRA